MICIPPPLVVIRGQAYLKYNAHTMPPMFYSNNALTCKQLINVNRKLKINIDSE